MKEDAIFWRRAFISAVAPKLDHSAIDRTLWYLLMYGITHWTVCHSMKVELLTAPNNNYDRHALTILSLIWNQRECETLSAVVADRHRTCPNNTYPTPSLLIDIRHVHAFTSYLRINGYHLWYHNKETLSSKRNLSSNTW